MTGNYTQHATTPAWPIRVGVNAAIVRDGAILLVEFSGGRDFHFNLPGGGVEAGESLHEALRREVLEETCLRVEVGRLLLVWEYEPERYAERYGPIQKLGLIFHCIPEWGGVPRLPAVPDDLQTGVRWVPLRELPGAPLLPRIGERLLRALEPSQDEDILVPSI